MHAVELSGVVVNGILAMACYVPPRPEPLGHEYQFAPAAGGVDGTLVVKSASSTVVSVHVAVQKFMEQNDEFPRWRNAVTVNSSSSFTVEEVPIVTTCSLS